MRTRRKLLTLPRLIIIGLFCLVSVFCLWLFIRSTLIKTLMTGIENMEVQGYSIGHDGIAITGFPFSILTNSTNIFIQAPSGNKTDITKNWSVKLDQLQASSATVQPLSWGVSHSGTARVDMHGVTGARYMFDIEPANLNTKASVSIMGGLKGAHFDFGPTTLRPLAGTPPIVSAVEHMQGDFTTNGTQGNIVLSGQKIILEQRALGALRNALGPEITNINLDMDIFNWPLLERQGTLFWQENLGRVRANNLGLKWGQIDLIGDFDIRFVDNAPDGIIHISIKDTTLLFDQISQAGLINPDIAGQAKLFLSTLKADENGRTKIELVLRDRKLKYGFITLYNF